MDFVRKHVVVAVTSGNDPQRTVLRRQWIEVKKDLVPTGRAPAVGPWRIAVPGCIARAEAQLAVPVLIIGSKDAREDAFDLRRVQKHAAKLFAPVDAG